jgi:diguanylate cyclase (GGDEF)-like protein/PAS domain S-box-containing protein
VNEDLPPATDSEVLRAPRCNPSGLYPPEPARAEAENPWKLALESSGEGVWDWNVATGEQTHSSRWKEMLGYTADEIGTGYHEFVSRVHPDDLAHVQAAATAYLEGRAPGYAVDLRMRCKDGSWKWVLARGMVVSRDAQGYALRMIGTHTDITERKQTEAALRELNLQLHEQTRLLQTTMASVSQGILMIDADSRVSTFNPRLCELLDMSQDYLATHPTLQEMTFYQLARGDLGRDACLVEPHARSYITAGSKGDTPTHYLRATPAGRTLEVKTTILPAGGMVRTFADVTDYVQAEAARKQLNLLLDATQAIARVGGWDADIANGTVVWTEGVYRILETSPHDYTPSLATTSQFFTPGARALIKASYADTVSQPETHDLELEMVTATGRHICVHSMGTTTWEYGRPVKRTAVLQDITDRKLAEAALRENEARWKLALDSTGDGVWDWYIQTGEEFFSKRLLEMYGLAEHEIADQASDLDNRTHPADQAQMQIDRQAHFDGLTPTYINEHRVRCQDGNWKWVLSRGMVISRDAQGKPLRMIGTDTDISERKVSQALIWQQAHFDALTALPNRNMLRDRLTQEIRRSRRDGLQLAILFIDLDHFKEVNDTLGHDSGDQLLVEAARRIQGCVRESDTVARMGGDEFTVILTDVSDVSSVERILLTLLEALGAVFTLGSERVFVSASIGITMYPLDATEIEDLFKNADQALYVAKGAGRNRFSFFTPALQQAAQTRVRLANDLRTGLTGQQFRVLYQPIIELATGATHKAEALIRWHHPTRGLISPAEFIPIAEASGLIVDIGEWVFRQAARQVQQWRATLDPDFQISVNKSPVQFHQRGKSGEPWANQLQAMGLPGNSIVLEITEGLLLDTSASVAEQLLELQDAGIQVSLDDFGTGYSSLSYLQKFDIDFLKIDQSFVRHLIPACTDLALCKAIIVMAHELGIKVIAEGVETEQQRELLAAAGCDYAQGYLFAQPMSAPEFEVFMAAK